MLNSFTSALTSVDQKYSLRELMNSYGASESTGMMTTSTLGKVIPDFVE